MESALADNALEIASIGGLIAVIVAFITIGSIFVFRLFNRVDQLADKLGETNERIGETRNELSEKIGETRNELSEKIGETRNELSEKIDQLREDMTRQMAQMKAEIISALVSHTHPETGGPPVFTAPPPIIPPDQSAREPEPTTAPADN